MPSELIYYELRNFIYVIGKNVLTFFFKYLNRNKSHKNSLQKICHLKLIPAIVIQKIILH